MASVVTRDRLRIDRFGCWALALLYQRSSIRWRYVRTAIGLGGDGGGSGGDRPQAGVSIGVDAASSQSARAPADSTPLVARSPPPAILAKSTIRFRSARTIAGWRHSQRRRRSVARPCACRRRCCLIYPCALPPRWADRRGRKWTAEKQVRARPAASRPSDDWRLDQHAYSAGCRTVQATTSPSWKIGSSHTCCPSPSLCPGQSRSHVDRSHTTAAARCRCTSAIGLVAIVLSHLPTTACDPAGRSGR